MSSHNYCQVIQSDFRLYEHGKTNYARRRKGDEWDQHHDSIRDLWNRGLSRRQIRQRLERSGFKVTTAQLTRKMMRWNLDSTDRPNVESATASPDDLPTSLTNIEPGSSDREASTDVAPEDDDCPMRSLSRLSIHPSTSPEPTSERRTSTLRVDAIEGIRSTTAPASPVVHDASQSYAENGILSSGKQAISTPLTDTRNEYKQQDEPQLTKEPLDTMASEPESRPKLERWAIEAGSRCEDTAQTQGVPRVPGAEDNTDLISTCPPLDIPRHPADANVTESQVTERSSSSDDALMPDPPEISRRRSSENKLEKIISSSQVELIISRRQCRCEHFFYDTDNLDEWFNLHKMLGPKCQNIDKLRHAIAVILVCRVSEPEQGLLAVLKSTLDVYLKVLERWHTKNDTACALALQLARIYDSWNTQLGVWKSTSVAKELYMQYPNHFKGVKDWQKLRLRGGSVPKPRKPGRISYSGPFEERSSFRKCADVLETESAGLAQTLCEINADDDSSPNSWRDKYAMFKGASLDQAACRISTRLVRRIFELNIGQTSPAHVCIVFDAIAMEIARILYVRPSERVILERDLQKACFETLVTQRSGLFEDRLSEVCWICDPEVLLFAPFVLTGEVTRQRRLDAEITEFDSEIAEAPAPRRPSFLRRQLLGIKEEPVEEDNISMHSGSTATSSLRQLRNFSLRLGFPGSHKSVQSDNVSMFSNRSKASHIPNSRSSLKSVYSRWSGHMSEDSWKLKNAFGVDASAPITPDCDWNPQTESMLCSGNLGIGSTQVLVSASS